MSLPPLLKMSLYWCFGNISLMDRSFSSTFVPLAAEKLVVRLCCPCNSTMRSPRGKHDRAQEKDHHLVEESANKWSAEADDMGFLTYWHSTCHFFKKKIKGTYRKTSLAETTQGGLSGKVQPCTQDTTVIVVWWILNKKIEASQQVGFNAEIAQRQTNDSTKDSIMAMYRLTTHKNWNHWRRTGKHFARVTRAQHKYVKKATSPTYCFPDVLDCNTHHPHLALL